MEPCAGVDDAEIDFSLNAIRRRLRRGFDPPGELEFQELCLAPDVILAFGGNGDIPSEDAANTPFLAPSMRHQVQSLHISGLENLQERIRQVPGHLLVCLETALPREPRPSIAFVAATWFAKHVSERGAMAAKGDAAHRRPGSLAEVLSLLAVLDFLTASDAGHGYTATRLLTLKAAAEQECLAKAELQLIFGPPEAEPVRATAAMRLLRAEGSAGEEALLRELRQLMPKQASDEEAKQLREPVQLLLASVECLYPEAPEETARLVLERLRLRPATASAGELEEAFGDVNPLDYLGVELYRSGINRILACFSSWTGYFAFESLQQQDIKACLTVLETSAAPCYDSPLGENRLSSEGCPHAGCIQELRGHIGQRLLEQRFERLHGQPLHEGGAEEPWKEKAWVRLFNMVDSDHNGKISMEEWWKALEDEFNLELRALFQFENPKMKKLLQKLFKSSVHEEAESLVTQDDFLLACRMASRDELMWHLVYMIAGHEMDSADDRSTCGEDPIAAIVNWNRRNIEEGLRKEHGIVEKYSQHLGIWQRLAQSPLQVWRDHCRGIQRCLKEIEDAQHGQDFTYLPGCDEMEEVLRGTFSEQLFIKVAFSTSKSRQDAEIFYQLVLLQCHVIETIWKSLFPKRCEEAWPEVVEQCPDLWLGIDYVYSKQGRVAYFSPEGFKKWRRSEMWREVKDPEETLQPHACPESSPADSKAGTEQDASCVLWRADDLGGPHLQDEPCRTPHTDCDAGTFMTQIDSGSPSEPLRFDLVQLASTPQETFQVHQPNTPVYKRETSVCQTVYPAMYPMNVMVTEEQNLIAAESWDEVQPLDARHYCQTDNVAIHVHCDLVANQSLMAATTEAGPCQAFQEALAVFTGYNSEEIHVQAMGTIPPDDGIALKAEIRPAKTSMQALRSMQKRLHCIKTGDSFREFFQKFPAMGAVHVSTACCLNQGGSTSTVLAGLRAYSHLTARVDVLESAADTDDLHSDRMLEVLSHIEVLGLIDHFQVYNNEGRGCRRLCFDLRPRAEAPTLEDMRTLQSDLAELAEQGIPYLLRNSLVIEAAVCHFPSTPAICNTSAHLCCHLDVTDENGWLHQHAGHRSASEFLCILKKIAVHCRLTNMEFQHVRIWRANSSKDFTVDFEVQAHDVSEARTIENFLWALHQRDLCNWTAADTSDAIFRGVTVKRPVRICGDVITHECHSWNLQPSQRDHNGFIIFAELEAVDQLGVIQCRGPSHFATLLTDLFHVVAGIEPKHLSVLSVSPTSRTELQGQRRMGEAAKSSQLAYSVKLEIDFSSLALHDDDLRSVLEALSALHSSATLRRWGDLPFFQQYFINGCVIHEVQTCHYVAGKKEWKPLQSICCAQPKVVAHLDLCSNAPFHSKHGLLWPLRLAEMLSEALHKACNIAKDDIVVTCAQLRAASQQRSSLVKGFSEALEDLELVKVASESSDGEVAHDGPGIGAAEILSESSLASYTLEFEVLARNALDIAAELNRLATLLRKFHSQAVRRRFAGLPLFQEFDFDVGIQLSRSSSQCLGAQSRPLEQHMLPRRTSSQGSPLVVLAGLDVQSRDGLRELVVFDGYTNIIQRGIAPSEYGPPVAEDQIRAWFLDALQYHLQTENLEVTVATSGTSLAIRSKDSSSSEPFQFDGLWLVVTGVRLRMAQSEKIQEHALQPAQAGAEAAAVTSGFLAYAIDFEVRRLADSSSPMGRYAVLAEEIRVVLHGCLHQLHRSRALKKKLKFYRHFEFDRGIQLDFVRYEAPHNRSGNACSRTRCAPWEAGCTDSTPCSTMPRTLTAVVRFHSDGSPTSPPTSSCVKTSMAALLGVECHQLEAANMEMKSSCCEAELTIRTLAHAPALKEVEALGAKLTSLHHCGVCAEQLGSWKPVAVVMPLLDKDHEELAVVIKLQLLPEAHGVGLAMQPEDEEVKLELEKQIGFSAQRLQLANVRMSCSCASLEFSIMGLHRERAALLKAFWEAARGRSGLVIKHWSCCVVDVKVVAAPPWHGCLAGPPTKCISEPSGKGLREAIKDYVHLCRAGTAGLSAPEDYQLRLLKHILDIFKKMEAPQPGAAQSPKLQMAQHGVAASLLQSFSTALLEVVEVHGKLLDQDGQAVKEYFLSQDWRPEEMRYALRTLTWVLAYDTNYADAQMSLEKSSSPSAIQAALANRAVGLAEVIRGYRRLLACLGEKDLLRGIYRPCSVLQNLLLALQCIQAKPCSATLPAWLVGTDFLASLGGVLQHGGYRMAYGHAVALVFQVATQMTCKAYVARMDFPQHTATICENVNKLMKVMQMWSSLNRQSNASWSKPLQNAMDTSLPEFVDLLDRLLPAAHASSPVEKLKEWTRTPSDNIRVIHDLMSSPPPRPVPAFCKCEA